MHTLWRGSILILLERLQSSYARLLGKVHKNGHAILYAYMFLLTDRNKSKPMTINKQLDKLCQEYFGTTPYVADGIFYGSADSRWVTANPHVLFMMKQPNSNDLLGEDYREYGLDTMLGNQNWEQLLARLYGIVHTTADGYPTFEEATRRKNLISTFTTQPFAIININKQEGSGTTDTQSLKVYARTHANFIRRQIDLLHPNIIVCCGSGVFDAVNEAMGNTAPQSGNWMKYDMAHDMLYFDTYHPGRPMAGWRLKDAYEMPLKEYCDWIKNKRQ